jgi:hypothetical protein
VRNILDLDKEKVVLDGATHNHDDLASLVLQQGGLVLSSGQLNCKDYGAADAEMPGWVLLEIEQAVAQNTLKEAMMSLEPVRPPDGDFNAFLVEKYAVAGGSARLLFEHSFADARKLLNKSLSLLDLDKKKSVLQKEIRTARSKAKNVLVQAFPLLPEAEIRKRFDPENMERVLLSKHVLRELRAFTSLAVIKKQYKFAQKSGHRVMEGWAFEDLAIRFLERGEGVPDEATLEVRLEGEEKVEPRWRIGRPCQGKASA